MEARLHRTVEELVGLREEWDALSEACGRPCSAPDLLLAWWDHVAPRTASPHVVSVREEGRLVGLAPFLIDRTALGMPVMRFLGTPGMPQRAAILASPQDEARVLQAVAGVIATSRPGPALVNLDRIDGSRWARSLADGWPTPLGAALSRVFTVPAPVLSMSGRSFDEWLAGKSPNFRREVRRAPRRLAAAGGSIRRVAGPEDLAPALDAFARLNGTRWGDRSELWRPPTIAMLARAGETMLPRGRMRVYTVEVDGDVIAVGILFAAGGEVSAWNIAWDPAWSSARPSMAALYRAIQDCFENGDRRLDLGEEAPPYKLRVADGDDPVSWTALAPRGVAYPAAVALMAPQRLRWTMRSLARRLPPPVRQAIRTLRSARAAS